MEDKERTKLLSQVPGMVYQFLRKPDGTYSVPYTSIAVQDVFGVSPEEVGENAASILNVILPEDMPAVVASIEESAERLALWQCEFRVQIPGQPVRWMWGQSMPEKLVDGSILWNGFIADITDRKEMEEELRRKTAFLEAHINTTIDGLLVVDSKGNKILQNQRLNDLLKIPKHIAEDVDDRPQLEFVTNSVKDSKKFLDQVLHLYSHADETSRDEVEFKDGSVMDRYSAPVIGKDGTYFGRIWMFRDITDRKKAEKEKECLQERLIQAEKMSAVGQLASGVAHEINNPLSVILGFAQGALRSVGPGSPLDLPLSSIEREAQRCRKIVQNLLIFARQGGGSKTECDLGKLVESSLVLIETQAKMKSVEVRSRVESGLPKAVVNENKIQQVLINLCGNALDAIGVNGVLSVGVQKVEVHAEPFIQISVADTGSGISKENLKKVFEPFFTTKEVGQGTGLGLFLVYAIVREHGGKIEVESELKKGTTFKVQIPASAK